MTSVLASEPLERAKSGIGDEGAAATDLELVHRYLDGDTGAFEVIFRRYQAQLKAACVRTMGDGATADDMVQETFYRVLRSVDRLDADSNFGGWIHKIAANVCNDELRRRQRRSKRESVGDDTDVILRVPDPGQSGQPETALEQQRLRRLIWEISKKLPERQRMVLAMRELEGKSYASIARVMGISESAVETLLHRARRRFREEFLLLDGPVEEEGICALVRRLVEQVGLERMQATQRDVVTKHVSACSWCSETLVID